MPEEELCSGVGNNIKTKGNPQQVRQGVLSWSREKQDTETPNCF